MTTNQVLRQRLIEEVIRGGLAANQGGPAARARAAIEAAEVLEAYILSGSAEQPDPAN